MFPLLSVLLALTSPSAASPVDSGLQAQIHPAGFTFATDQLSGLSLGYGPEDIDSSWECYDELSIYDFNLGIEIESVAIVPRDGVLSIDVQLGQVRGERIRVVGVSGWIDLCIDFDADIQYVQLTNGRLQGELAARVVDGALQLSFVDPPTVSGALDSDVDWFPDDLVWAFMEDTVLSMAGDAIAEQVPALVSELTADSLLLGTFGETSVLVDVGDVSISRDGLYAAADVDLGGDGSGRGAALDLEPRNGSHLAVGLTAGLAQEVLEAAWKEGLLSPESDTTAALLGDLLAGLGLGEDVELSLGLDGPPSVEIDPDGIRLSMPGTTLIAESDSEQLLKLVADLDGRMEVTIAHGGISLTAHELGIVVDEMDVSRLVDGDPDNVRRFLEGWVTEAATEALADVEVYGSRFEALGYVLHLDETESQDGGLAVWSTIYDADDPAVDRDAPDTSVSGKVSNGAIAASFEGTDDRPGALMFSWRLDEGSWSSWSPETLASIEAEPGKHRLEVISRDDWHNVDPTPAAAEVTVGAAEEEPEKRGCGCDSTPSTPWSAALALGALGVLGRRRR